MSLDQIAAAFDRRDYNLAARLLKDFLKESPQNPWGYVYKARLYEVSENFEGATSIYQQLLKSVTHPKIMSHARQGLQRIEARSRIQRQQAIEEAKSDPQNTEPGLLILEAISPEMRQKIAKDFAKIMNLDVYTARLHMPNRGWKIYRLGAIGEMKLYTEQLRAANIPVFCTTEVDLQQVSVFEVQYFEDYAPKAIVVCQDQKGQLGSMTFDWSEVSQRVEGQLPVLENVIEGVVDREVKRRSKAETLDYLQVYDLHLPKRRCVLRICDWHYQFDQGIEFGAMGDSTIALDQAMNRMHWNSLKNFLNEQLLKQPLWADFSSFGETAIEFPILLERLPAHIQDYSQANWASAFHLYSSLAFNRDTH